MKKLILALALVGTTTAAFAGSFKYTPSCSNNQIDVNYEEGMTTEELIDKMLQFDRALCGGL